MDRAIAARTAGKNRSGATSPLYILAAGVVWALVFYSLSPLSRPQPARLAARAVQVCDAAAR